MAQIGASTLTSTSTALASEGRRVLDKSIFREKLLLASFRLRFCSLDVLLLAEGCCLAGKGKAASHAPSLVRNRRVDTCPCPKLAAGRAQLEVRASTSTFTARALLKQVAVTWGWPLLVIRFPLVPSAKSMNPNIPLLWGSRE